jgi:hypothetical protein
MKKPPPGLFIAVATAAAALGLAVGVAMIGFAAMSAMGWIEPTPDRLLLLPAIVCGLAVLGGTALLVGGRAPKVW